MPRTLPGHCQPSPPGRTFFALGLALLLTTGLAAQQAESTRGVALVLGNAAYTKVKPLANPGNDAEDIAAVLTGLGWDVTLVKDADLKRFRSAVQAFSKKLVGQKAGLFYYAGHGIQSGGVNYLVPVDAEIALEADYPLVTLPADYVLGAMEEAKVPLKLMILDACRDNPFAKVRSAGGTRGLVPVQSSARGTILVYATAPNDVSQDGQGRNGVFTQAFLTNLRVPGVDFQEIFDRTAQAVSAATGGSQNPWMNKSFYGRLYFVSPDEAQRQADQRLAALKVEQDKLALEMADRTKALAGAKSRGEKDRLELEQKKAQALVAAQTEEQAALERTKVQAGLRAEEEAKNRAAQVQRTQEAEAQLVALRQQVETQRKAAEQGAQDADDPIVTIARLQSLEAALAEVQRQFDESLQKRVDGSTHAWQLRVASINQYTKDPWENKPEFEARKADAIGLATRDKDNEVAGLKDSFAQAFTRESAALAAQRDAARTALAEKEWPLPPKGLILTRGTFDEDRKIWPLTVELGRPSLTQTVTYQLVYQTRDQLKTAYLAFDTAWKAGALVAQASMRLTEESPGYWRARLAHWEVSDLTRGGQTLVRGVPGADLGWVGAIPKPAQVMVQVPRTASVWRDGEKLTDLKAGGANAAWLWTSEAFGPQVLEARYAEGDVETLELTVHPGDRLTAAFQKKDHPAQVTVTVLTEASVYMGGRKLADLKPGQPYVWKANEFGPRVLEARYAEGVSETVNLVLAPGAQAQAAFKTVSKWEDRLVSRGVRPQKLNIPRGIYGNFYPSDDGSSLYLMKYRETKEYSELYDLVFGRSSGGNWKTVADVGTDYFGGFLGSVFYGYSTVKKYESRKVVWFQDGNLKTKEPEAIKWLNISNGHLLYHTSDDLLQMEDSQGQRRNLLRLDNNSYISGSLWKGVNNFVLNEYPKDTNGDGKREWGDDRDLSLVTYDEAGKVISKQLLFHDTDKAKNAGLYGLRYPLVLVGERTDTNHDGKVNYDDQAGLSLLDVRTGNRTLLLDPVTNFSSLIPSQGNGMAYYLREEVANNRYSLWLLNPTTGKSSKIAEILGGHPTSFSLSGDEKHLFFQLVHDTKGDKKYYYWENESEIFDISLE